MDAMITCPVCGVTAEPAAAVAPILVCGHCGASLVDDPATGIRRATGNDTPGLKAVDLRTLQQARARLARPERL